VRTSCSVLTQTQTVQYSLLHTYAIWYSLLLLGYKPVQHVTVLNTAGNCNTVGSIILWHHRHICGPSLTETSLCGAWLYIFINTYLDIKYSPDISVQNSEWTNSATHSGPLQQLVTMNYDEHPSISNCHQFLSYILRSQVQFICCSCCVSVSSCVLNVLAGKWKN